MRFSDRVNYMTVLGQMHRALYDLNVGVDFVFPQTEDLSRYRVLLVPPLYVATISCCSASPRSSRAAATC
jgi:beta-galactosidase GanA